MSLKRFERIKKESQEKQIKESKEDDEKPKNPHKWEVNEKPKNELTNNRFFRILWKRIFHDLPF